MVGLEPLAGGTYDEPLDTVGAQHGNVYARNNRAPRAATIREVDPGLRYLHSSTPILTETRRRLQEPSRGTTRSMKVVAGELM